MREPDITPLAKRLTEDAGVAWRTLGGTVTERDVLAYLSDVVTGAAPVGTDEHEIDFSSLAASLSQAVQDLLAGSDEVLDKVLDDAPGQVPYEAATAKTVTAEAPGANISTPRTALEHIAPRHIASDHAEPKPVEDTAPSQPAEPEGAQIQLEAERLAHAETRARLSTLETTTQRQKILAAQLRPLSAEIRRLGSALGRANSEMERLRPLESATETLQTQLEQARLEEVRMRLLYRELQAQSDLLGSERRRRRRWLFWRR